MKKILIILILKYCYFLNEIYSCERNNIYSLFYEKSKIKEIKIFYYPGNDINECQIYDVFIKILKHFKEKPKQACFICMCGNGYYYSTRDEEPNEKDLNQKCPFCEEPIGSKKEKKRIVPVKRDNYFRVLTQEEYNNKKKREFHDYDYITIDDFKDNYIETNLQDEKGISKISENHLNKHNKIVRDLSQVSYRLLNFILYSHLFLARLLTDDKTYDNFLPDKTKDKKDLDKLKVNKMKWGILINQLWELLKKELNNNGINSIDTFLDYIFNELFIKLNKASCIKEYQGLKKLEKELNTFIKDKIELFKKEYKQNKKDDIVGKKDEHFIYYLLIEKYTDLNFKEYPFYQNFLYSDYLNESYLLDKLKLENKEDYPLLIQVLQPKTINDCYPLDKLELFNNVLNLFSNQYLYKISSVDAEKKILENEQFYKQNSEKIDDFIKFYNSLKKKNKNKQTLKLNAKDKLINFFVDENTDYGKSYKEIYQEFINEQNEKLEPLLRLKIKNEIFDKCCLKKINIQSINENEIFTLKLPKNFSFADIAFDHSYRKTVLNKDYKSYNQFIIDYDCIEKTLTELLLKNKKLLNNNIINFVFTNHNLAFENSDIITTFNNNPNLKLQNIDLKDKVTLYEFYDNNNENSDLLIKIKKEFMKIIIFLNNNKENKKILDKIASKNEISDIFGVLNDIEISEEFKKIFIGKKNMTIDKITNLFIYYLRLIFVKVIKDKFMEYQSEEDNIKKSEVENYFNKHNDIIEQKSLRNAIRLLITLYLIEEDEKEQKIKNNKNNFAIILNIKDIWININTNKKEFIEELKNIKKLKIQINQIIYLYDLLSNDEDDDDNFFNDVEEENQKKKENDISKDSENVVEEDENDKKSDGGSDNDSNPEPEQIEDNEPRD